MKSVPSLRWCRGHSDTPSSRFYDNFLDQGVTSNPLSAVIDEFVICLYESPSLSLSFVLLGEDFWFKTLCTSEILQVSEFLLCYDKLNVVSM